MKLPWGSDELEQKKAEIEELEERISELKEEKQSWKNRFESEKERRKKLSKDKQEAEEELNKLRDKLRNDKSQQQEEDTKIDSPEGEQFEKISFGKARDILEKLDSIESREKDFVTVYSPDKIEDLEDLRGLKNSISADQFSKLQDIEGFVGLLDQDTGNTVIKMSSFFDSKFVLEEFFDIADLLEFFDSEKYWVIVSAGETKVFREESGEYEEIESIKSRVDREHSKGGFSQGRFERKRDEQIEGHVKQVKDVLEDFDEEKLYLLGDKNLCKELQGEYLGGFDPNRNTLERFYQSELMQF